MIPLRLRLLIAALLALALLALPLLFANQEGKSMSNTLRKYDSSGNLAWSVEIENFTGKQTTDPDGNIYALTDYVAGSSWAKVHKFSPDGTLLASALASSIQHARDIHYGRDGHIHVCGGDAGPTIHYNIEGWYFVFNTDLELKLKRQLSWYDLFVQVRLDAEGCIYFVSDAEGSMRKIYKYAPAYYTESGQYFFAGTLLWETYLFNQSPTVPVIAVPESGGIYVAAEIASPGGLGQWIQPFGLEYWTSYWGDDHTEWDGEKYVCVSPFPAVGYNDEYTILRIEAVGTWMDDLAPSRVRVHFGHVDSLPTNLSSFQLQDIYSTTVTPEENAAGFLEREIPLKNLREWFNEYTDNIRYLFIGLPDVDIGVGTYVSNIEFFIPSRQYGITALTSDGEFSGFVARDTEIQQMLFTADGEIVVKEDDQNISLIDLTTGSSVWSYDTGMQVHSIIPGPDGLISFEEADVGTMTLSSSPEISGTESQNIQPNGNIIFSQPTPEIDGYQITVSPLPGEITFQGDANIPAAINVSAGSIAVSGDAGVVVPVVPPAGSVQFSGTAPTIDGNQTIIKPLGDAQFSGVLTAADISGELTKLTPLAGSVQFTGVTPDIGGDLTIVKPLGTAQFSADPSIDGDHTIIKPKGSLQFSCSPPPVFLFGVDKSSGLALLSPPATMELSSNYVDINQQTIYVDPGEIRVSGDIGGVGPDYRLAQATVEFPSFELDMVGGASIEAELPLFEMDAIGFIGYAADLSLTFPSLSVESHAGGYVAATMPSFDFVMEATAEALATISLTFPSLGFSGTATPASEGDINMTMPGLQMAMEATAGLVGELIGRFPRLGMTGTLLAGTVGQIEGSFRIMDLNMSAGPTGPGAISMEFPIFDMAMTSGSVEAGVLRYARERIR